MLKCRIEFCTQYQIDEAALLLNVGEYQRAIDAAQKVLTQWGDNADCYKIIGVAHGELKHKAEALKYLQRAKDLGDKSVDNFIEKYKWFPPTILIPSNCLHSTLSAHNNLITNSFMSVDT